MPYDEYMDLNGHWIKARCAKRVLFRLADRLDAVECHDRARYLREHWERVAADRGWWAELNTLTSKWEAQREAVAVA